ncbi:MAG TPA: hypothetical protein VM870_02110 [Pyrinomonadaceae bacterium]|nr:hypothetical protein [Pyrinomonadaceae bacterium]
MSVGVQTAGPFAGYSLFIPDRVLGWTDVHPSDGQIRAPDFLARGGKRL